MVSVFSENLRVYNAQQFRKSLLDADAPNIYLTFGRPTAWSNDAAPPQANSSVTSFNDIWLRMIGAKQISGYDVRHAIPRYDWTANTSYAAYDHCTCSLQMFAPDVKFYVLTTDWNVYKCLSNNNGSVSTVMPTQVQTNTPIEESDGYIWKYMYTLTAEERVRFMTDSFIPVQTLDINNNSLQWRVQEDAVDGAIESVKVTNGGSGYKSAANVIVSIQGDGSSANAIARINATSQTISSIIMTNHGKGYTFANVNISGEGTGATARAMISPTNGHGSDALRELGGSYLILNPRIRSTESGKFPDTNEFRQIAIIQDPIDAATGNTALNQTYSQLLILTVSSGADNYQQDEIVYQGGAYETATFTGIVSAWDSGNNLLKLTSTVGTPVSSAIVGRTSATSRDVESITNKELTDRSGKLLYIDYLQPITRSIDQTEDYKIILKF